MYRCRRLREKRRENLLNREIILIAIVPACAVMGKILSFSHTEKREFYEDFLLFLSVLEKEVGFTKNSFPKTVEEFKNKRLFYEVLTKKKKMPKMFSESEKTLFTSFFNGFGRADAATETKRINLTKKEVEEELKSAKEKEKKYKPLYFKLGILLGLLIYIVLI